jgi:hypothetical protein
MKCHGSVSTVFVIAGGLCKTVKGPEKTFKRPSKARWGIKERYLTVLDDLFWAIEQMRIGHMALFGLFYGAAVSWWSYGPQVA